MEKERIDKLYRISGKNLVEVLDQNLDLSIKETSVLVQEILGVSRTKAYDISKAKNKGKGPLYKKMGKLIGSTSTNIKPKTKTSINYDI